MESYYLILIKETLKIILRILSGDIDQDEFVEIIFLL